MIVTFGVVYWLQSLDKNFKNKKMFDKFKLPVLTSAIVGLVSNYYSSSKTLNFGEASANTQEIFTEMANF